MSLFLLALGLKCSASDPLDTWHWRRPAVTGNQLFGATYGNGRYVVVGEVGTALASPDGRTWSAGRADTRGDLRAAAFGDGQFVAVGTQGELHTSSDGQHWQQRSSGTFSTLNAVAFGGGTWVAVGESGTILASDDGVNWTTVASGGLPLLGVAWGNGSFLVVGGQSANSPQGYGAAAASINGFDWHPVYPADSGSVWFRSVAFGAGRFVVSTSDLEIFSSSDLIHWASATQTLWWGGFAAIGYSPAGFVGLGGDRNTILSVFHVSKDGSHWEPRWFPENSRFLQSFTGIASGPDGVVLAGGSSPWNPASLLFSADLTNWTQNVTLNRQRGDLRLSGGYFFSGPLLQHHDWHYHTNSGVVFWRSENGLNWELTVGPGSGHFGTPAFGNGVFVSVGDSGQIAVSTNASDWTLVGSGVTNTLNRVVFADGTFVAVGSSGRILASTDGTNWTARPSPTEINLENLVWNSGKWLASSPIIRGQFGLPWEVPDSPGAVLGSANGLDWDLISTNGIEKPVVWKTGFAKVDAQETGPSLSFSDNGKDWTSAPTVFSPIGSSLFSEGGRLFVTSYAVSRAPTQFYASDDGTNWTRPQLPFRMQNSEGFAYGSIDGLAFDGTSYLLHHSFDYLVQSDPVTPTAPRWVEAPHTVVGGPGTNATLRVSALGTSPLGYQWKRNGQPLAGATNTFLTLPANEDPAALFSVAVSNSVGQIESETVQISAASPATLQLPSPIPGFLALKGTAGRRYRIERSDGLESTADWIPVDDAVCDTENWVHVSAKPDGTTNFFYRAMLVR